MQRIFDPACSPQTYQQQDKTFAFPDLTEELCPHCFGNRLKRHGYYHRWLGTIGFSGLILIRRFICKRCGKTLSLLPSFAHPQRGYGLQFILGALKLFYLEDMAAAKATRELWKTAGIECSRQLLRQFRQRFKENLNFLAMEVIGLLKLKAPPLTAPMNEKRQRARQLLECTQRLNSDAFSLKLFERSGKAILTSLAK